MSLHNKLALYLYSAAIVMYIVALVLLHTGVAK
jgi:hypothetical protein